MTRVVSGVVGSLGELEGIVRDVDRVWLTAEQRERGHFRARSEAGVELAVSVPRGRELQEDDVLSLDADGQAIVVAPAGEDLLEVRPRDAREWGAVGYQIGNMHRPARFLPEAVLTPFDPGTEQLLQRLDVPYSRHTQPFVGTRYVASGHSH